MAELYDVNAGAKQVSQNYQDAKDRYRFNLGMNLLGQTYGPVAYVPEQANATENYLFNKANNPQLLAAQGLTNQTNQQTLDYNTAANPLRLQAAQLGNTAQGATNAFNAQNDPLRLQAAQLGNTAQGATNDFNAQNDPLRVQVAQQGVDATKTSVDEAATTKSRTALSAMLTDLNSQITGGADPATAFDNSVQQISTLTGVPVEKLATYRAGFVADPQGTISRLQGQISAVADANQTPEQKTAAVQAAAQLDYTKAQTGNIASDNARADSLAASTADKNAAQADKLAADAAKIRAITADPSAFMSGKAKTTDLAAPESLEGMQQRYALLKSISAPFDMQSMENGALADAAKYANDLSPSQAMNKMQIAAGMGSATNLMAAVDSIKANLSLLDLRNLREYGLSLGRTNLAEFKAAADAFVAIDPNTMTKSAIQKNITHLTDLWASLNQGTTTEMATMEGKIKANGGMVPGDPNFQPGVQTAAPQGQSQSALTVPPIPANTTARSYRNNNFGNIEDGPFAKSQPGYVGSDGRFAIFSDPQAGTDAMGALLGSYSAKGLNTVQDIINRWAPPADHNDTSTYVSTVAKAMGVAPGDNIDLSDPAVKSAMIAAMSNVEGGNASGAGGGQGGGARPLGSTDTAGMTNGGVRDAGMLAGQDQLSQPAAPAPNAPAPRDVAAQAGPQTVGAAAIPQMPMMSNQQLSNPDTVVPGTGGATVAQVLLKAREAMRQGMDATTAAAIASKLGIPPGMITGRQQ